MQRKLNTVREARQQLGNLSHSTIYKLIASGELETLTIGRRRLVTDEAIATLVAKRLEAERRRRKRLSADKVRAARG